MNYFKSIALVLSLCVVGAVSCKKDKAAETKTETAEPAEKPTATEPVAEDKPEEKVEEKSAMDTINEMAAGCETSAEARAARQAEKPLYERLGGKDPITAVTKGIIARHVEEGSPIKDLFANTDLDKLAEHVVNFVGAGTGGPEKYTGRNMKDAHAALKLTPEQFLAAGEDIMQTLEEFKVPANETEEFMCIILSFKDDVLAM